MNIPFFIVGTQRSGTTLLFQMLNTHPELYVSNEFWGVYPYINEEANDLRELQNMLILRLGLSGPYILDNEETTASLELDTADDVRRVRARVDLNVAEPVFVHRLRPRRRHVVDRAADALAERDLQAVHVLTDDRRQLEGGVADLERGRYVVR